MSDVAYLMALTQVQGLGPKTLARLLTCVSSPEELWRTPAHRLREWLKPVQQAEIMDAWADCQSRLEPLQLAETYQQLGIHVIPYTAPAYPPLLAQIYAPPIVLYVRGNPDALSGKTLAFVGTRKSTPYGRQVVERMIQELAPARACIVSGLASGIDGCAHEQALAHGLATVAVFGCGIDQIFPKKHERLAARILESGGALVSEYPMGVSGSKSTFPQRNRIIAGLSHGVVVVEGGIKSGSLITARHALEEDRTVFAVPGNIFAPGSQGPLRLIRDGATPLITPDDMFQELQWLSPEAKAESEDAVQQTTLDVSLMSAMEKQVLEAIDYEPTALELVQQRASIPAAKLSEQLTLLELAGAIAQLPGAKVCRR